MSKVSFKYCLEKFLPLALSFSITIVLYIYFDETVDIPKLESILNNIISLSGTFIGFFLAIAAIFISLIKTKVLQIIRKHGGWKLLTWYFCEPIIVGGILIIFVLYITFDVVCTEIGQIQLCILVFLFLDFFISSCRLFQILLRTFYEINGESQKQGDPPKKFEPGDFGVSDN